MADEEIYEDLRSNVRRIGKTKFFLDSLQIAIDKEDFKNFLELYRHPLKLKNEVYDKQKWLVAEQKRIDLKIKDAT